MAVIIAFTFSILTFSDTFSDLAFGIIGPTIFFGRLVVPISIFGIIIGIMGLKSTKKSLAIAGIILSLIGLGTSVCLHLIILGMP